MAWVSVVLVVASGCAETKDREAAAKAGIEAVEFFDFTAALHLLRPVQAEWPEDDPRWLEITYALGLAAWHASPPRQEWIELADRLFERIAEREGDNLIGAMARMNLARIAEIVDFPGDEPDFETALSIYDALRTEYAGEDIGMQAALRQASLIAFDLTEASARQAIALLAEELERNPDTRWAPVVWQYIGDLYIRWLNEIEPALEAYTDRKSVV